MNPEQSLRLKHAGLPLDINGAELLVELALNLNWSWNEQTRQIWKTLDPSLWEATHNPWIVLRTVSRDKLREKLAEPAFSSLIKELTLANQAEQQSSAWFQKTFPNTSLRQVAYFSMEYMLTEALPIYSGGLGNVAGDQLKAASDLGVPVTAVGLLFQQGYFRQMIDKDGAQQALYPYNDPGQLPITPVRKKNGEWLRLQIEFPGWSLWVRAWQAQVGRVRLYLLDSNDPVNLPAHRGITSELYGGGSELRLKQELLLGICGWRLLHALDIHPDVCHLNEGHAAFAVLERIRLFMEENQVNFYEALAATRAGNLFTTHTAVPAGFDRFSPALISQYLKNYTERFLGISIDALLALGRIDANQSNEPFTTAYLAIRACGAINGVSSLHGQVSRKIFEPLFPHWPRQDVPVGYVTNGIHVPSWISSVSNQLWTEFCGKTTTIGIEDQPENAIQAIPNEKIWQMKNQERHHLIEYTRERLSRDFAAAGLSVEEINKAKQLFDPNRLTLGFARRFATYKRPNMLLHDPERLIRILTNATCPVQLILAGKAHPADLPGQQLILDWTRFLRRPEVLGHVVFLSDYDMLLTQHLVRGVDVWINTPRRPWEACGTSGMKILANGGLNLSELDGWWVEAYHPDVGWALGDGEEHGDDLAWDAAEANALYALLEQQIVPEFYNRSQTGLPDRWIQRMKASMAQLTPQFSANRAVRDYTREFYLPAAEKYKARAANEGLLARNQVSWSALLKEKWPLIRFENVKERQVEKGIEFEVLVYLDGLSKENIRIELYADGVNGGPPQVKVMDFVQDLPFDQSKSLFRALVEGARNPNDYTARIIPCHEGVAIPLEEQLIKWQR